MRISLVFAVFIFSALPGAAQAQQAEVMNSFGDVQALLKNTGDYSAVEEGMILEAGDTIKTGSGATVELSFNEDNTNVVRLSENTAINVTFSGDEKLEMSEGEVFSSIGKLESGSSFEIRTPTVVSGARGTDWVTKVTEEGTDVEAINDEPYVRHFEASGAVSRRMTPIKPGQMTTVKKFQKPQEMRPIADARRHTWQHVKQNVRANADIALIKRNQRPKFDRNEFIRQRQKPQSLSSRESPERRDEKDRSEAQEGRRDHDRERQGFRPLSQIKDEQGGFKPLASYGSDGGRQDKIRTHPEIREQAQGLRPLSSTETGSKVSDRAAQPRQASTEDKAARVQEPQKGKQRQQQGAVPAQATAKKKDAGGQDTGQGKQDKIPGRKIPSSKPPAAGPARR